MIVYFSGTGNTRHCAMLLSRLLGDVPVELTRNMLENPEKCALPAPDKERRIIWMFPVYSWGIPVKVLRAMRHIHIADVHSLTNWMVCTCGDDIGRTAHLWRRAMRRRHLRTAAAFSVQMPNTYVFMKGFDVDSPELEHKKIADAEDRLHKIAALIAAGRPTPDSIVPGRWAWVKTALIRPYFNAFCTGTGPFAATDACVGCGLCARRCPMQNITITAQHRPAWGNDCLLCTRCYHICPAHAVAYGRTTAGKGQFTKWLTPRK